MEFRLDLSQGLSGVFVKVFFDRMIKLLLLLYVTHVLGLNQCSSSNYLYCETVH